MAVRSEREKSKMLEKYQLMLSQMLKEEDNKLCVDCDTKSPRWASWNIGVFICIRCAGFHRNLGVHISKVKSVNLDSWTGEQIASIQAMGNSRARAVYEANLPDGFRRPQTDSTLETFIRAKYEQRKWIAKEWIPLEITVPIDLIESETNEGHVETTSDIGKTKKNISKMKPFTMPAATNNPVPLSSPPIKTAVLEQTIQNLLNLDEPISSTKNNTSSLTNASLSSNTLDPLHELFAISQNKTEGNADLQGIDKDLESAFSFSPESSTNNGGVMSNEKIMALFNTPQTSASGMNTRAISNQASNLSSPTFPYPSTLQPHQKSLSFGSNLYQQANNLASHTQQQSTYSFHPGMNHYNTNDMSVSTDQSTFTNLKSSSATGNLISTNIPMCPITEYIPASSNSLWQ